MSPDAAEKLKSARMLEQSMPRKGKSESILFAKSFFININDYILQYCFGRSSSKTPRPKSQKDSNESANEN
jgi:hypothetical protein